MKKYEFIPALRYHFLTPIYDRFFSLMLPEKKLKNRLIELAGIRENENVLDFGCGTGTLIVLLKAVNGLVNIVGIDNDRNILKIAQKKISQQNWRAELVLYEGYVMPFPDNHFDVVLSSWVFHHLYIRQKITSFREINRVLKPGGRLLIADWGKAGNWLMRSLFFCVQLLDNFKTTQSNVEGKLPAFIQKVAFTEIEELQTRSTIFGTLSYYRAFKKPLL